jgi:hypothetical protein
MEERKILNAETLRGLLLASIEAVIEGRMNVAQANAIVGLSGELHKSIRQEWDIKMYADKDLNICNGVITKIIEHKEGEE